MATQLPPLLGVGSRAVGLEKLTQTRSLVPAKSSRRSCGLLYNVKASVMMLDLGAYKGTLFWGTGSGFAPQSTGVGTSKASGRGHGRQLHISRHGCGEVRVAQEVPSSRAGQLAKTAEVRALAQHQTPSHACREVGRAGPCGDECGELPLGNAEGKQERHCTCR